MPTDMNERRIHAPNKVLTFPWQRGEYRRISLADVFVAVGMMFLILAFAEFWRASEGAGDFALVLAMEGIQSATDSLPGIKAAVEDDLAGIQEVLSALASRQHASLVKFLIAVNIGVGLVGAGILEIAHERLALRNQM